VKIWFLIFVGGRIFTKWKSKHSYSWRHFRHISWTEIATISECLVEWPPNEILSFLLCDNLDLFYPTGMEDSRIIFHSVIFLVIFTHSLFKEEKKAVELDGNSATNTHDLNSETPQLPVSSIPNAANFLRTIMPSRSIRVLFNFTLTVSFSLWNWFLYVFYFIMSALRFFKGFAWSTWNSEYNFRIIGLHFPWLLSFA